MNDTFIHFTPATTIADTPRARLLDDTTVPVAEVDLGPVDVNVRSAGHARRIAAAFVVAADLLDAAQPPEDDGVCCFEACPAEPLMRCTLRLGHDGDHVAHGARPRDEPQLTWPTEAAEVTR